eukprot:CAMPEP_0170491764 /NCGR_PEP_ID=MMETSP0208-20121228/11241_1 /TAXON_ID=197538 /ORGANISM="Strombidium inclinatum, Strain S3" /LENGTH=143 /DNA_ID=CAMNT_0010767391 /DNA_START=348 /DNA_END=776 /DNA_ORIENTATION=-
MNWSVEQGADFWGLVMVGIISLTALAWVTFSGMFGQLVIYLLFLEQTQTISDFFRLLWSYVLMFFEFLENLGVFLQWVWDYWIAYAWGKFSVWFAAYIDWSINKDDYTKPESTYDVAALLGGGESGEAAEAPADEQAEGGPPE